MKNSLVKQGTELTELPILTPLVQGTMADSNAKFIVAVPDPAVNQFETNFSIGARAQTTSNFPIHSPAIKSMPLQPFLRIQVDRVFQILTWT